MTRREAIVSRLRAQLQDIDWILDGASEERLSRTPDPPAWSARENLAHLARHHEVMLDRIERILREDRPAIARYNAAADPDWPTWSKKPMGDVLHALRDLRAQLVSRVEALSEGELERVGVHGAFGPLSLAQWLEFFLIHEAHHLYVVLLRARR
jgi:DinB superfamily